MKHYDEKYFGITVGIFSDIIFILAVINILLSQKVYSYAIIKSFIPFFNNVNAVNIIGGIIVSFVWGWILGYFFMLFYNWFDKLLNKL